MLLLPNKKTWGEGNRLSSEQFTSIRRRGEIWLYLLKKFTLSQEKGKFLKGKEGKMPSVGDLILFV